MSFPSVVLYSKMLAKTNLRASVTMIRWFTTNSSSSVFEARVYLPTSTTEEFCTTMKKRRRSRKDPELKFIVEDVLEGDDAVVLLDGSPSVAGLAWELSVLTVPLFVVVDILRRKISLSYYAYVVSSNFLYCTERNAFYVRISESSKEESLFKREITKNVSREDCILSVIRTYNISNIQFVL